MGRRGYAGDCDSKPTCGLDYRKGAPTLINVCPCTELHPSGGFSSWYEVEALEKEIARSEFLKEVSVTKPTYGEGLPERWFQCSICNRIWALIYPDAPFQGSWRELTHQD